MKPSGLGQIEELAAEICSECGRAEQSHPDRTMRAALERIRKQAAETQQVIAKVTNEEVNG